MTHRKPVTISDVAHAAGVSPGTVSRVLNQSEGDSRISAATRQLVLETVQRLGYRPNLFASALRTQRTGVIGAIVRDINDPFFGLLARELQQAARREGFEILLGHAQDDLSTAERQLAVMTNWFDGVLVIGDMAGDHEIVARLEESRTPYVSIVRGIEGNGGFVNIDDMAGIRLAMEYLTALGHRRIAFAGAIERVGIHRRLVAYQDYVSDHGLVTNPEYVRPCANEREQGYQSARVLLGLPEPPTAIVCATDLLAVGAIAGAWSVGWRVPEAVSIIGFDDIEEGASTYPPLTTVRQPVRAMANAALELLTALMNDEDLDSDRSDILISPTLTVRRSCAPPAS